MAREHVSLLCGGNMNMMFTREPVHRQERSLQRGPKGQVNYNLFREKQRARAGEGADGEADSLSLTRGGWGGLDPRTVR